MSSFDYKSVDWPTTFERIRGGPRGTLTKISRKLGIAHQRLSTIHNCWLQDLLYGPTINTWGGNNRAFTQAEEATVIQTLIKEAGSKGFPIQGYIIKEVFRALYSRKHPFRTRMHNFNASNGFLHRLTNRCRLSGRRSQKVRKQDPDEEEIEAYRRALKECFEHLPPSLIFNSDETPVHVCPTYTYTTQYRGQPTPAVRGNGNPKDVATAIATVSADGKVWPLTIVAKGTTPTVVRNLDLPDEIWREYSPPGKTNSEICIRHIERISKFAKQFPCALIWDGYRAHWTEEVKKEGAARNVTLIQVPDDATSVCQPLDTTIFPVVSGKHQALLRQLEVFESKPLKARKDAVVLYNCAWKSTKGHWCAKHLKLLCKSSLTIYFLLFCDCWLGQENPF